MRQRSNSEAAAGAALEEMSLLRRNIEDMKEDLGNFKSHASQELASMRQRSNSEA
eukprot:CAMPEP_0170339964 /NCGR_PEP_ID=MMETSP0116_2-20130129/71063_1 /TAXON_ID=400756 /ORGANISM="Durinskia baltica, Strain CSIRO CS-38" /LENGTH=54 /DNA_ID=CAMNT_0010593429 /DNA_START=1 /DNA_END=161 /DNA_ORIENTATION=-